MNIIMLSACSYVISKDELSKVYKFVLNIAYDVTFTIFGNISV